MDPKDPYGPRPELLFWPGNHPAPKAPTGAEGTNQLSNAGINRAPKAPERQINRGRAGGDTNRAYWLGVYWAPMLGF